MRAKVVVGLCFASLVALGSLGCRDPEGRVPATTAERATPVDGGASGPSGASGASAPSSARSAAPTPSAATAPSATASASSAASAPDAGDARESATESPKVLLARELDAAKAGRASVVELRVWKCGASCTCPPPCLQIVAEDLPTTWVVVVDGRGAEVKLADWQSADLTGSFTGKVRKVKGPSPTVHDLPELRLVAPPKKLAETSMAPPFEGAEFRVRKTGGGP